MRKYRFSEQVKQRIAHELKQGGIEQFTDEVLKHLPDIEQRHTEAQASTRFSVVKIEVNNREYEVEYDSRADYASAENTPRIAVLKFGNLQIWRHDVEERMCYRVFDLATHQTNLRFL